MSHGISSINFCLSQQRGSLGQTSFVRGSIKASVLLGVLSLLSKVGGAFPDNSPNFQSVGLTDNLGPRPEIKPMLRGNTASTGMVSLNEGPSNKSYDVLNLGYSPQGSSHLDLRAPHENMFHKDMEGIIDWLGVSSLLFNCLVGVVAIFMIFQKCYGAEFDEPVTSFKLKDDFSDFLNLDLKKGEESLSKIISDLSKSDTIQEQKVLSLSRQDNLDPLVWLDSLTQDNDLNRLKKGVDLLSRRSCFLSFEKICCFSSIWPVTLAYSRQQQFKLKFIEKLDLLLFSFRQMRLRHYSDIAKMGAMRMYYNLAHQIKGIEMKVISKQQSLQVKSENFSTPSSRKPFSNSRINTPFQLEFFSPQAKDIISSQLSEGLDESFEYYD